MTELIKIIKPSKELILKKLPFKAVFFAAFFRKTKLNDGKDRNQGEVVKGITLKKTDGD